MAIMKYNSRTAFLPLQYFIQLTFARVLFILLNQLYVNSVTVSVQKVFVHPVVFQANKRQ